MADNIKYIDINLPDGTSYPVPDLSLDFSAWKYKIGDTVAFIEKTEGRDAALEYWSKTLLPYYAAFLINLLSDAKGWSSGVKTLLEQLVGYAQASEKSITDSALEISNYLTDISNYQQTISGYKNTISDLEKTIDGHRQSVQDGKKHADETHQKIIQHDKEIADYIDTIDIYKNTILKYTQDAVNLEKAIRGHAESALFSKDSAKTTLESAIKESGIINTYIAEIKSYEDLIFKHKNKIIALELEIEKHTDSVITTKTDIENALQDTEALYYKTAAIKVEADKSKKASQQAAAIATSHIETISPDALKLLKQANDRDFENSMGFNFL